MATEKLFRKDTYLKEFSAEILTCEEKDGKYETELNRTCFYPEGGGQNADIGTLGTAKVLDTRERGDKIIHITDAPLEIGATVEGKIDWMHRFSLMQHHTGEHIVSGIVHKLFKLDNVGFHMGSAMVTVDFNGELAPEDIEKIELLANRAVFANLNVAESYPAPKELAALNYRSKKALSGEVRIITIPGIDCCACCGTHVAKTGEVGLIKLLSPMRYKGGVRIGILCGERALKDYRQKDCDTAAISQLLSAKQQEIASAVERLIEEQEKLKQQLLSVQDKLFKSILKNIDTSEKTICIFQEELTPNELRRFCTAATELRSGAVIALSGDDKNGYRYALGIKNGDARALSKSMHGSLGGKGGGTAQMTQGSLPCTKEQLENFINQLSD